jgi:protoheme IX farnesyltransferase
MPLLIGWSAANMSLSNPIIIFISFFIYMWQIPHFWLLHIKYAEDYEKAGLGVLHKLFSNSQIKRIIFAWIIATSLTSLLLPYFEIIKSVYLGLILLGINLWLDISLYKIIFKEMESFNYKKAFIEINAFMIIIMSLLIVDYFF